MNAEKLHTARELALGVATAKVLGGIAYARGEKCIPAHDAELTNLQRGRSPGDPRTIPELKGWIAGWNEANTARR